MTRQAFCALFLTGAVAACVPTGPQQVPASLAPAPLPRVEPARAINLLYEHNFAATLARRMAEACGSVSANEGAIANGEAQVNGVVAATGLSDDEVRARLDALSASRLSSDLAAFTNQTGIRFSDPASNCSVARGQIAGGSRIGSYLSDIPGAGPALEAPEAIAAEALSAIGSTGTETLDVPPAPDGFGSPGLSGGISNQPLPPAEPATDG